MRLTQYGESVWVITSFFNIADNTFEDNDGLIIGSRRPGVLSPVSSRDPPHAPIAEKPARGSFNFFGQAPEPHRETGLEGAESAAQPNHWDQ